jgi:hypothetical protein
MIFPLNDPSETADPCSASNTRSPETAGSLQPHHRGRGSELARRSDNTAKRQPEAEETGIRGVRLKPIRVVVRELTRPDGKKLKVEVPVYPPFQLEERSAKDSRPEPAAEDAPDAPVRAGKEARGRRG